MLKKDANRIAKVNSLIKRELGPILLRLRQGQDGLVTITKVETSKDMKWAKVWISILPTKNPHPPRGELGAASPQHPHPASGHPLPLGEENNEESFGRGESSLSQADEKPQAAPSLDDRILKFLAKNIYGIQGELNKYFYTKIIPKISFHLDIGPRYAQHIDEVIRKIHSEENLNPKD